MIDQQHSTAASNLVAIDIAENWNVALAQDTCGQRHRFKFAKRGADHDRFVQFLRSLPGTVRIGLEPTGDYHRPIAHRLLREGFEVVAISSLALARFFIAEAWTIAGRKVDKRAPNSRRFTIWRVRVSAFR